MRYDKRGTVAPERAALDEEAKRLKVAARYLGEERRRQYRALRWVYGAWLAFVVCSAGAVGGWLRATSVDLEADTSQAPPAVWASSGVDAESAPAAPIPAGPFPGQAKPPCGKRDATLNGGCWREMAKPPDPGKDECGPDEYLYNGKCYIPVKQAKRLPTSVMP